MIKSHEARERARASANALEVKLEALGKLIETAADAGKREIYVFPGWLQAGIDSFSHPWWNPVKLALKSAPNNYQLSPGEIEVGGGLGDMDHDPANPRMAAVLYIRW